jgi:type II secretory pathway pseudopilin PulG
MKILVVVLIVIIVVLAALLITSVMSNRGGAVRRDELKRANNARHTAQQNLTSLELTVDKIESTLDGYSDIESPLAAKVRQDIREYRRGRIDQTA